SLSTSGEKAKAKELEANQDGTAQEEFVPIPPLCGSVRLWIAIFCLTANFLVFYVRFSFSISMVCMTGSANDHLPIGNFSLKAPSIVQVRNRSPQKREHEVCRYRMDRFEHCHNFQLQSEFDWDRSIQANMMGTLFYGFILTQVLGGWISDKFGGKQLLVTSMSLLALTSFSIPLFARLHGYTILAIRLVQGMISGLIIPTVISIIPSWCAPEERGTLMSFVIVGLPLSNFLSAPISGLLCATGFDNGWPLTFYFPGILTLIWTIAFHFLASNTPEQHPKISSDELKYLAKYSCRNQSCKQPELPPIPYKAMLTSIPFWALIITQFCSKIGLYSMALTLPLFINEVFHFGIIENGLLSGLPWIGMIALSFTGQLSDYLIRNRIFSVTQVRKGFTVIPMLTWAVLVAAMGHIPSEIGQMVFITIAVSIHQLEMSGGFFISHSDLVGPYAGSAFGITNTIAQLPGFIIPILVAYFAPHGTLSEWRTIFYIASGAKTVGAVIYLFFGSLELQSWAKVTDVEAPIETKEEPGPVKDTKVDA
ncbi:hypothetical protein TCAL_07674, partial [Tigriopus californicus]